jgi:hypothetical protein
MKHIQKMSIEYSVRIQYFHSQYYLHKWLIQVWTCGVVHGLRLKLRQF